MIRITNLVKSIFTKSDVECLHDALREKSLQSGSRVTAEDNAAMVVRVEESSDQLTVLLSQTLDAYISGDADSRDTLG